MAGSPPTVLVLTNSGDATADYLIGAIEQESVSWIRLNTDHLVGRVRVEYSADGPVLMIEESRYFPCTFAAVWNRRPERLKHARFEATPEGEFALDEWSEALEGFLAHIDVRRWLNHPSSNAMASHKLEQLTFARSLGLLVPETLVTQDANRLREFYRQHGGSIVAKPLSRGYVERPAPGLSSLMYTNRVLEKHLEDLGDLSETPTLFQRYIEKSFDVRLTVVDDRMHAVELRAEEDGAQRCDIRRENMADVRYREITLPDEIASLIARLLVCYGLRFAAIDFVVGEDGRWYFLEVNPNGQWAWMDIEGVTDIASSFVRAFRRG